MGKLLAHQQRSIVRTLKHYYVVGFVTCFTPPSSAASIRGGSRYPDVNGFGDRESDNKYENSL